MGGVQGSLKPMMAETEEEMKKKRQTQNKRLPVTNFIRRDYGFNYMYCKILYVYYNVHKSASAAL